MEGWRVRAATAMRAAATAHSALAVAAGNGQGVDRHLFALWSLARQQQRQQQPAQEELPIPLFSDRAWGLLNTSVLSTSNVNAPCISMIAFGAVCPEGYGIGYVVEDEAVTFSIASFANDPSGGTGAGFGGVAHSAGDGETENAARKATDSVLFAREVERALLDMQALCAPPMLSKSRL